MQDNLQPQNKFDRLTTRESQVLYFLAQGFTTEQVSQVLNISVNTEKIYIRGILRKLEVPTRTMAVSLYWKHYNQEGGAIELREAQALPNQV